PPAADCWRAAFRDAFEIGIGPRGDTENEFQTLRLSVSPRTSDGDGAPCWFRRRDQHAGAGAVVAPGVAAASVPTGLGAGYTIEVKVPLALVPAALGDRPDLNLQVFDGDGDHRSTLSWSAWDWPRPDLDPYGWGRMVLAGYVAPLDRSTELLAPVVSVDPLPSFESPPTIHAAVSNGVPLGAGPAARGAVRVTEAGVEEGRLRATIEATASGTARVFVWTPSVWTGQSGDPLFRTTLRFDSAGARLIDVALPAPVAAALDGTSLVLVALVADEGGTAVAEHSLAPSQTPDDPLPFP
ncbi:MAG TPA: sugar-binding protein, partial [Nitriliruptorales bacterium]